MWDECTMAYKVALEALDRTLREINDCQHIMGGIPVLLLSDFRQTFLVVPKSTRTDVVKLSIKLSPLWQQAKKVVS